MKTTDFMVGDWLRTSRGIARVIAVDKIGLTFKIDGGDFDIDTDDEEEWFCPIPLTPEILEKNGFRKGCYVGGYYSTDCPFRVFTKAEGKCEFTALFDDEIHFSCVFVHQLQQALRLCGINKEIEL